MPKNTRKQKMDRQRGLAADRAFDPIRAAIDSGALVITPATPNEPDPRSGREYCPRCASGPRQREDIDECPDCGYHWSGPPLINSTRTGTTFPTWVGDAFPGELDARGIVVTCPYCDNLGRVGGCPACGKVKA